MLGYNFSQQMTVVQPKVYFVDSNNFAGVQMTEIGSWWSLDLYTGIILDVLRKAC